MQTTDWKQKAIRRSQENKLLKKRIKELTISRDNWKKDDIRNKATVDKLTNELEKFKKKLNAMAC
jgi:hypothetical protein